MYCSTPRNVVNAVGGTAGGSTDDLGRHYISVLLSDMYIYNYEYLREELYI